MFDLTYDKNLDKLSFTFHNDYLDIKISINMKEKTQKFSFELVDGDWLIISEDSYGSVRINFNGNFIKFEIEKNSECCNYNTIFKIEKNQKLVKSINKCFSKFLAVKEYKKGLKHNDY